MGTYLARRRPRRASSASGRAGNYPGARVRLARPRTAASVRPVGTLALHRAHCVCLCARYTAFGAAFGILAVGLNAKPDTSLVSWAREEAKKQLDAK